MSRAGTMIDGATLACRTGCIGQQQGVPLVCKNPCCLGCGGCRAKQSGANLDNGGQ